MTIAGMCIFMALWIVKNMAEKRGEVVAGIVAVFFILVAYLLGARL